MIAVDTNVLVRYLIGDDPQQAARARGLVDGNDIFVPVTVVLECDWVLRSAYGFPPLRCAEALAAFAGLPRVTMEDPAAVARALDCVRLGMDFADALHLAKAGGCEAFASFDRRLARAAASLGVEVRAP